MNRRMRIGVRHSITCMLVLIGLGMVLPVKSQSNRKVKLTGTVYEYDHRDSQQVKENKRMNLFAKVAFDRVVTSDYDYDGRTYLSISLGCNF